MSSVYYLISNWVAEWEHRDFLCRHFYRSSNWKLTMNQSLRRGGSSFLTDELASIRMYISVVDCMFESETWYIVWRYAELRKWYEWSLRCIRRNIFFRKNWRLIRWFRPQSSSWWCIRARRRRTWRGRGRRRWWRWSWGLSTCGCARWCTGLTSTGLGTTWKMNQVAWK